MRTWALIGLLLGFAGPAYAQDEGGETPFDAEIEGDPPEGLDSGPSTDEALDQDIPVDSNAVLEPVVSFEPGAAGLKSEEARAAEFASRSYAFCHDEDWNPPSRTDDHFRFCALLDDTSVAACPRAKQLCDEPAKSCSDKLELPKVPDAPREVLIGLMALVSLIFFFRALVRRGLFSGGAAPSFDAPSDAALADLTDLPEAPPLALLRRAERLDAEGKTVEAASMVQVAALRYLDDHGLVEFHPSRTNGDYLRRIRGEATLHAYYRRIAEVTDRIRFGDGQVEPSAVPRLIAEGRTILGEPRKKAASAAPLLLALLLLPSLHGCGSCLGEAAQNPIYSRAPSGLAALRGILDGAGIPTEITRKRIDELSAPVLVLRTSVLASAPKSTWNLDAALDAEKAIVLFDDAHIANELLPVKRVSTATGGLAQPIELVASNEDFCGFNSADLFVPGAGQPLAPRTQVLEALPRGHTGTISRHRLELVPLVEEGAGGVLAYGVDRIQDDSDLAGCLVIFADDGVFRNAALTRAANARFTVELFERLATNDGPVSFLERFAGAGSRSGQLRTSALGPFLLHAGLWIALLFISVGAAFGVLRDPTEDLHKRFSEHVRAIGRHYDALGAPGWAHASKALARLVVVRHRRDLRGGEGWAAVAGHLAEKYGLPEADVRAALALGLDAPPPGVDVLPPEDPRITNALSTILSGGAKRRRKDGKWTKKS